MHLCFLTAEQITPYRVIEKIKWENTCIKHKLGNHLKHFPQRKYTTWKDAIQMKTTMIHHLTGTRMAVIKKSNTNKCWQECGENRTLPHWWWECKMYCSYGKQFSSLKKLNSVTYKTQQLLDEIHTQETQKHMSTWKIYKWVSTEAFLLRAPKWEQSKRPLTDK